MSTHPLGHSPAFRSHPQKTFNMTLSPSKPVRMFTLAALLSAHGFLTQAAQADELPLAIACGRELGLGELFCTITALAKRGQQRRRLHAASEHRELEPPANLKLRRQWLPHHSGPKQLCHVDLGSARGLSRPRTACGFVRRNRVRLDTLYQRPHQQHTRPIRI